MKKIIIIGIAYIALLGCSKDTNEISNNYNIPPELQDCKFYYMSNGLGGMKVVRCPNSVTSVSYPYGKTTAYTATVEVDVDTTGYGEYQRLNEKFNGR